MRRNWFLVICAIGFFASSNADAAMPPAATEQLEAARAHAQQLADTWLAGRHDQIGRSTSEPAITAGTIVTTTVDVRKPAASPRLSFMFKTGSSGFSNAYFQFFSLSTGQSFTVSYSGGIEAVSGKYTIETPGALNQYAAPGTYTMLYAGIGDNAGGFVFYSASQLSAIFPNVNVTVVNAGVYDTTVPVVQSGEIRTPTISLSSRKPLFIADLTVSDTVSGVSRVFFELADPNGGYFHTAFNAAPSPIVRSGNLPIAFDLGANGGSPFPTGTWTISQIIVYDVAGNSVEISNPSDVQKLLGANTFQVTQ